MKFIETLEKYLFYTLIAVFPVFTLTLFSNPYIIPKEVLLVGVVGVALVLWFVKAFVRGDAKFAIGKFDLGVLLVIIAYLLSTLIKTPNKMEAFLFPGTTTIVIAAGILYFLLNQLDVKGKLGLAYSLLISAVLLSLSVLFTEVNLFAKVPQLPALFKDPAFSTLGGVLPAIMYVGAIVPLTIGLILKEKEAVKKLFAGVCLAVMTLSLVVLVKNALPGSVQAPRFPDYGTSWAISIETLKQSPIWGVGPANYLSAFNVFRPVSYNNSDLWSVRFTTGSDLFMTIITELGFVGILAFAVLLWAIYKSIAKGFKFSFKPEVLADLLNKKSLILLLILMAIFPTTPILMFPLFVLLSLISKSEEKVINLGISSKVAVVMSSLPVMIGLALLVFFGMQVLRAEVYFQKALNAVAVNDAKSTYNYMQLAVNTNTMVDRYHASFAQIDMALASSLANQKTVSDADKTTITQLIQQAINEGKSTIVLNSDRSGNWEILAQIYRSVMPYATGADQFAIQTYTQAIALDPTNPNLRISLGGVYYALGRYDDAIAAYKMAILAKSDLANAHYNLAIAYQSKKDYTNAIAEVNTVLTLVQKDSSDYTLAKTLLDSLQAASAKATAPTQGETLTSPQPIAPSNIKPPITLPQGATPPSAP